MNDTVLNSLIKIAGEGNATACEPMSERCTFRTGGCADYFAEPSTPQQIVELCTFAKDNGIPLLVIGNGSNLLVSDEGFRGLVVCIGKNMSGITVSGTRVRAMAGATLAKVAAVCAENSLTGFEFASGIPGTVGGAVCMNAGAYGGEIKDVAVKTTYIDRDGNIKEVSGEGQLFGYRTSLFEHGEIVVECEFEFKKGDMSAIRETMAELNARRKEKQPLEYPSAGSTFKRPVGNFAGRLIEDSNLKGFSVGGAEVSAKHAGFVINKDNATTKDIVRLMAHIQKTVYDKFGVKLEPEVKLIGEGFEELR